MKDCKQIYDSPDKPNVTYSVLHMDNTVETEEYFEWIVNDLATHGTQTPRVIIYC